MKARIPLLTTFLLLVICMPTIADDDGFVGANLLRSNPQVTTYRAGEQGVPVYVEGNLSQASARGNELQAALSFFATHKGAYRMLDPNSELNLLKLESDRLGMRHLLFEQRYLGLKVVEHGMRVHFNVDGVIRTVEGHYLPQIELDTRPSISPTAALSIAESDLISFFGSGDPSNPELVVFYWEDLTHLAFRIWITSGTPMGRWEYFVDAHSGEIIYKANRIMDDNDIGTGTGVMGGARNHIDTDFNGSNYRMYDDTRQAGNDAHGHGGQMPSGRYIQTYIAGSSLPGSVATDADNVWDNPTTQAPAVDGHVYSALMYDWLLSHFNRNSYDDAGANMRTSVNYYAEGTNNAYWNGSQIVIWDWSAGWRSLAGCPDVIAHEWGHAVTEYCSGLLYQLESGALNESFSDMLGAAFEFAHDSMDVPDWDMGENGRISGVGFRSMSDPHSHGDPDFYGITDPYWVNVDGCSPSWSNDYCGVHTNSGVGNKWLFLLSDGGTHHGVTVTGIGVDNAILIAYRANRFYWSSQTNYHEAALGTISAANDLDPSGVWTSQVANAWNAVGVSTPAPSISFSYPGGIPATAPPDSSITLEVQFGSILGGVPLAGSGRMFYNLNDGPFVEGSMTHLGSNLYEIALPSVACNNTIGFYVRGREAGSGYVFDPADTTNPYRVVVASAVTTILSDDFESDQGWTVSGNAVDGQWNRGVPVGGGDRGDPPSDFDGSGKCYLTDNVDGNSDVDGGTTWLTSPTFDLSSGDAQIHYARWYSNNFGADPNNDLFYVAISNNNGSSWTTVETVGPSYQSNGGWNEHSFLVSSFVTPTASMKVRFEASDLNAASVVEAAVDAFSVMRYECGPVVPQVAITTDNLPDWTQGAAYSQQLEAVDGTGQLTWTDLYSDLAGTGLSLSASGLLSGTPSASGTISFTASVTDEVPNSDEMLYTFTINSALSITTTTLPEWTQDVAYSSQCQATGGTGPRLFSDKNNDLVGTGLTLASDGTVSGTPIAAGSILFVAAVSDQVGAYAEGTVTLTINAPVVITSGSLADGTETVPYSQQLTHSGGTGSVSYSDKNNDLAGSGLSLASDGLLSGTPLDTGIISLTVRAQDAVGSFEEKPFTLTVGPDYICGDVNNDAMGPDVADLTYLVAYMFTGGPPPPIAEAADVDTSGELNVADITYLVAYFFSGGPPLVCQ